MCFEWRSEIEGADLAGEVEQSHQTPFMSPGVCNFQLVSQDVERRALPPVRRLHFDETWRPIRRETGNIICRVQAGRLHRLHEQCAGIFSRIRAQKGSALPTLALGRSSATRRISCLPAVARTSGNDRAGRREAGEGSFSEVPDAEKPLSAKATSFRP